jgi:hypothetical protein
VFILQKQFIDTKDTKSMFRQMNVNIYFNIIYK